MGWRCRRQTSGSGEEGEQKCNRGDQLKYAIDAKAHHEARAKKRPENGAEAKEQDEPATHCNDLLTVHAVMRGHRCGKILQRDPQGNEGTKEPDGKLNAASCKHQGSDLRTH
jgi:hypothetical protein